jgi:ribonucleoside-diphosphate reductase subunit M1
LKNILDDRKIKYEYLIERVAPTNQTFPRVYHGNELIGGFWDTWHRFLQPDFDFEALGIAVKSLVENLNIIIDKNDYPLEECKRSNMKNRPIGIGVQGLADVFMIMMEAYDSELSRDLNQKIFETIYYNALEKSCELAQEKGVYNSYENSPVSNGILHFDHYKNVSLSMDWDSLREKIKQYGVRNSLLVAPMPTASTSQILGNTESFEPLTSNFYVRRTLAGEFFIVNKHLRKIFEYGNIWNESSIQNLIVEKGSILNFDIPLSIKKIFRTVWEIPQKHLIDMASDRQKFIDQSQSFNIYLAKPDMSILTKIHFYGWKKQLETGCYYLRTKAAITAQNFGVDVLKEKEICSSCSS